jgi:hypothetical protein
LLAEWDEMKKLYRGPYIDAFCQAWFHLAQLFQKSRLKHEKVNGKIEHMVKLHMFGNNSKNINNIRNLTG